MESRPANIQKLVDDLVQWSGDRMEYLNQVGRTEDLYAIYEEWWEWIESPKICPVVVLEQQPPGQA